MNCMRRAVNVAILGVFAAAAMPAAAQVAPNYPSRPVTIIVPTPAGGPSDTAARLVAKTVSASWGQPVIVENRPGAGGAIAAKAVMSAPADGYTLLWAQAAMAGLPFVQKDSPYKSMSELAPVSNAINFGFALFVNRDLPVHNFADLVAYARAQPYKLNYGTGTLGEYMVAVHVLDAVGIKAQRVPYKGGTQVMPDLINGQLQFNFGPIPSGLQHVRAGKVKMLATALPQRVALLPDVPTLKELGIPPGNLPTWNALFAPPGTPRELTEKIATAVVAAVRDPSVRGAMEAFGAEPLGSTPAQLAQAVEASSEAWHSFVRKHDIPQE